MTQKISYFGVKKGYNSSIKISKRSKFNKDKELLE